MPVAPATDEGEVRTGGVAALEVGKCRDRLRKAPCEEVRVGDLQLRLFAVVAEGILVEQLAVLIDGERVAGLMAPEAASRVEVDRMAKDPVCGMKVDEQNAAATSVYHGVTCYFCATACKLLFGRQPEKYVGRK